MKKLSIALLLCFALTLSAHAQVTDKLSVQAEGGTFDFSDLLVVNSSPPTLRGTVTNNTNHDWLLVEFEIFAYDNNGNRILGPSILNSIMSFPDFKRGTTRTLGFTKDGAVLGKGKIVKVSLSFASGTYNTEYIVAMIKPQPSQPLAFEDDLIGIEWVFNKQMLGFVLRNKTDNPIKIDWNQVSYIDIAGNAQKVIHKGVRLMTRNDTLPPSLIPPTAKLEDMIFPVANVEYQSSGWHQRPMFPDGSPAKEYKGKTFSVFMPLEINGATKNYLFTLQIVDVKY